MQVKAERANSPEVKNAADELVRQRALAVLALRKTNAAIEYLRKQGATIPVDMTVTAALTGAGRVFVLRLSRRPYFQP
jgi:hypothetical protein